MKAHTSLIGALAVVGATVLALLAAVAAREEQPTVGSAFLAHVLAPDQASSLADLPADPTCAAKQEAAERLARSSGQAVGFICAQNAPRSRLLGR